MAFEFRPLEEVRRLGSNLGCVHLIGLLERPCVGLFAVRLEHRHYPPGTLANDLFEMRLVKWEDMVWSVVTIPTGGRPDAAAIADGVGLRFADGVPTVFAAHPGGPTIRVGGLVLPETSISRFPLDSPTAWTLEQRPDSELYRIAGGRRDLHAWATEQARIEIEQFQARRN